MAAALAVVSAACEPAPRPADPPPADPRPAEPAVATPDVAPPQAAPRNPDFEDAAGVVQRQGEQWVVVVPGRKPICLPFDAPAEARQEGAAVRFTLYLSPEWAGKCQLAETLISMRAEPAAPRTTP